MNGFCVVMILLGVFGKDWEGSVFQSDCRVRFLHHGYFVIVTDGKSA